MKINLNEAEIQEGVRLWIEREGFSLADKTVDITFTAGRGPTGLSCDVDAKSHTMIERVQRDTPTPPEVPEEASTGDDSPFLTTADDVKSEAPATLGEIPALNLDLD